MTLFPEGVDLSKLSDSKWYALSAKDASVELGAKGRERILARLRQALGGDPPASFRTPAHR
jgi:hypothetical protein